MSVLVGLVQFPVASSSWVNTADNKFSGSFLAVGEIFSACMTLIGDIPSMKTFPS